MLIIKNCMSLLGYSLITVLYELVFSLKYISNLYNIIVEKVLCIYIIY